MRKFFVIATAVALVSFGLAEAQENPSAVAQNGAQGQNTVIKTKTVSGGNNMGTYINAVQAHFGDPNVIVTLPTMDANKK